MTLSAVYNFINENGIPSKRVKRLAYYSKHHVDVIKEKSDGREDSVRRAVSLGGPSDTVASLTGALAERFHGSVPEKIKGACATYIPSEVKSTISSYEAICLGKGQHAKAAPKQPDNSFNVIRQPDGSRIFAVPSYRTDIINTLKERFGDNITIM